MNLQVGDKVLIKCYWKPSCCGHWIEETVTHAFPNYQSTLHSNIKGPKTVTHIDDPDKPHHLYNPQCYTIRLPKDCTPDQVKAMQKLLCDDTSF